MKALKIVLISIGGIFLLGIIALVVIGANSPETYIYTESEIPAKYRDEIKELSLLTENESIVYLYSDAIWDIKNRVYLLTDKHLILYIEEWEDPKMIIEFDAIDFVHVEYDKSFLNDSFITVETNDGAYVEFPVSSEKGRDYDFFTYLQEKVEDAHSSN